MKKLFTILMVVSVLGMMIGCSKPAEETPDAGTAPATGTEAPK
jgi:hypothetical protein